MAVSQYFGRQDQADLGTLDASGANTVVYAPGWTVHVKRAVLVTTVAQTTADATITVAVRDVDNGNSTDIGTFVLPFTGSAADDVAVVELAARQTGPTTAIDGSIVYEGGAGPIEVKPGQEIAFTSDGGGDAGTYQVYVEYVPLGVAPADVDRTLTFTLA